MRRHQYTKRLFKYLCLAALATILSGYTASMCSWMIRDYTFSNYSIKVRGGQLMVYDIQLFGGRRIYAQFLPNIISSGEIEAMHGPFIQSPKTVPDRWLSDPPIEVVVERQGWPFQSFECELYPENGEWRTNGLLGGIIIGHVKSREITLAISDHGQIQTTPGWRGVLLWAIRPISWTALVNFASFFTLAVVLRQTIKHLRRVIVDIKRQRRLSRSLCPTCVYRLDDSECGCPECGWNRPKNKGLAEGHD